MIQHVNEQFQAEQAEHLEMLNIALTKKKIQIIRRCTQYYLVSLRVSSKNAITIINHMALMRKHVIALMKGGEQQEGIGKGTSHFHARRFFSENFMLQTNCTRFFLKLASMVTCMATSAIWLLKSIGVTKFLLLGIGNTISSRCFFKKHQRYI